MKRHLQRAIHLVFGCMFAAVVIAAETGNDAIRNALMVAAVTFVGLEVLILTILCIFVAPRSSRPCPLGDVDRLGAAGSAGDGFLPPIPDLDAAETVELQDTGFEMPALPRDDQAQATDRGSAQEPKADAVCNATGVGQLGTPRRAGTRRRDLYQNAYE